MAAIIAFPDPPLVLDVDSGNGILSDSWKTVDVAALVPEDATAVLLNLAVTSNASTYHSPLLRFRAYSANHDSAGLNVGPWGSGEYRQAIVELGGVRQFQWRNTTYIGGNGTLKGYILAYFVKP